MTDSILYPHEPSTLLALLESHLPYSLPVYGTLKRLPLSSKDSQAEPAWASFPSSSIPNLFTSTSTSTTSTTSTSITPTSTLEPTSTSTSSSAEPWIIITHLPSPLRNQIRLYSSSEHPSSSSHAQIEKARQQVLTCMLEFVKMSPEADRAGAVNLLWSGHLRDLFGTKDLGVCDTWIKVDVNDQSQGTQETKGTQETQGTQGTQGGIQGESDADMDGLVVDDAREEDCEMIMNTRDIPIPLPYYHSLVRETTVIRTISTGTAISWSMTQHDGVIGSLYTLPDYRRRGLAQIVVEQRIKRDLETGFGVGGYCYIYRGNKGSEGLFGRMGWQRRWGVQWVSLR
ncbi:hypothetical protein BCR39DRAFT_538447 [Naematelia encephala]|uniref:N-acetyltransferase domain-containing protein n=1 Tax=Naematelia encephala TaxID=71784 RepID=A0A1Y2AY25_9TREE|nr:hypothetical protein BCR39DRAFT_538447 [Naematelia encephala]